MTDNLSPKTGDYIHAIVKGAIGSVPIVGGPVSELLGLIVASPLEKRRSEYLSEIGKRLNDLMEKKSISIEELSNNDQFIDIVTQATTYALKTSEKEKIALFQNIIINSALGESPEKTISHIYLNLLDSYTVWHIKILHFIDNPKDWFTKNAKPFPTNLLMSSLSKIIKTAFPDLQEKDELLNLIWRDLKNAGFHDTADLKASMSMDGLLANRTTKFGKRFLQFISSN